MMSLLRLALPVRGREAQRRRELRDLLERDDWVLTDIGLTRAEIAVALRRRLPESIEVDLIDEMQRQATLRAPHQA